MHRLWLVAFAPDIRISITRNAFIKEMSNTQREEYKNNENNNQEINNGK